MANTALVAMHYQNEVLHPQGRIKVGMAEARTIAAASSIARRRCCDLRAAPESPSCRSASDSGRTMRT